VFGIGRTVTAGASDRLGATLVAACLSIATGAGIAIGSTFASPLVVLAGVVAVIAVPIALAMTLVAPGLALFALVAVQPFEGAYIQSPLGQLTIGIVVLALFLLVRSTDVLRAMSVSNLTPFVFLYLFAHVVHIAHTPVDRVAGEMTQMASYGAMFGVGAWAGSRRQLLPLALGAIVALGTMSLMGLATSAGLLEPERVSPARTIFGITSPFMRSYGTNLPYDATALLVPLAVAPTTAVLLLGRRKLMGLLVLAFLVVTFLLVFQSRSMLAQTAVAVGVIGFVSQRLWLRVGLVGAGAAGALFVSGPFYEVDAISSSLRADGFRLAGNILSEGLRWVPAGLSADEIAVRFQGIAEWAAAVSLGPSFQPIHNLFLWEFVHSGLIVGLLLVTLWLASARKVVMLVQQQWSVPHAALLAAFAMATLEMFVDPISSNVLGLWVLLGFIGTTNPSPDTL
jgi:hypothetical protein